MAVKKTFEFFFAPLLKKFFQDMGRDPNNLEMILLRQKAGQQLKDSTKVIPFKQKRSFAEEIDAMKKSGDLVDEDNIIISDKITDREMFKNSNLNKPTIEGQMEKITGASNKIKEIQKEIDNMYKPKSDAEIKAKYDKENKESIQRFKDKMKKDEPEDKADGGRIGFRAGKFVLDKIIAKLLGDPKKVKQAADDIFPTGDYKYDAQMAAEALVENNPKIFKNKLYDDLDMDTQIEIYGAVLEPIQKNMSIARQLKKASRPEKTLAAMKEGKGIDMSDPNIADEFTRFMKETDPQGSKTIEQTVELANFDPKGRKKNATGGRAGFYTGGITDVEPSLDDIGHGADAMMARTRLMSPGSQTTTSTGLNYLLAEDNDNMRVPFGSGNTVDDRFANSPIPYKKDGFFMSPDFSKMTDEEIKMYKLRQEFMKRGFEISPKSNPDAVPPVPMPTYPRKTPKYAEGGRIGFAVGGDAGRRAFLKLMATLGGVTAAAKSGILGLGGKETVKKTVAETVKQSAGSGTPPPYFFKLVEKIKTMGDDTLASKDKAKAYKYKDYVLEEDFAGNIEIMKKQSLTDNPYPEDVYMSLKVDDVSLKGKKGSKKVQEYEEYTARPDGDGKMKDVDDGVPDEVVQEGTMFEDTMTEFGKTKKADGGRIGYNIGGLSKLGITGSSRRFLEKVFGKEKFARMIENDPELHRGMLEVVEMFRSKDKEGLKMYMQKFLPHMDDEMVEDFIVGGGGTEGIEGQLIRLGSGRDYKGKLDMIKEAENVRKLEDFDIEGVSKNAEGGRIGFSGGGIFRAIIAKAAAAKGMKPYEFIKVTSYKSLPQEVKMFLSAEDFARLKSGQQDMYTNYIDMAKTRKNFQEQVEGGKTTPARELFEGMEKTMDEQSYVPKTVTDKDIAEMELMVKNQI
jgi:hypothetical protein